MLKKCQNEIIDKSKEDVNKYKDPDIGKIMYKNTLL